MYFLQDCDTTFDDDYQVKTFFTGPSLHALSNNQKLKITKGVLKPGSGQLLLFISDYEPLPSYATSIPKYFLHEAPALHLAL